MDAVHVDRRVRAVVVVAELLESGRPKVKKDGWQEAFRWEAQSRQVVGLTERRWRIDGARNAHR